jgi:hypothetical protein
MNPNQISRGLALAGLVGGAILVAFGLLAALRPAGVLNGPSRDVDSLIPLLALGLLGAAALCAWLYWRRSEWPRAARLSLLAAALGGLEVVGCWALNIGWPWWVIGYLALGLALLVAGAVLLALSPAARAEGVLCALAGLSLLLTNFEDARVLLLAAAGVWLIALAGRSLMGAARAAGGPQTAG